MLLLKKEQSVSCPPVLSPPWHSKHYLSLGAVGHFFPPPFCPAAIEK